jgi:hypothetical protein
MEDASVVDRDGEGRSEMAGSRKLSVAAASPRQ